LLTILAGIQLLNCSSHRIGHAGLLAYRNGDTATATGSLSAVSSNSLLGAIMHGSMGIVSVRFTIGGSKVSDPCISNLSVD
jgi:hypothetical protein